MPGNVWLLVANKDNWLRCQEAGLWGLEQKRGQISQARIGDRIVAYISGEAIIAGIGEITSEGFVDRSSVWKDRVYPYRWRIRIELDFANAIDIRQLVQNLSAFTVKDRFSVHLRAGVLRLGPEDFELIATRLTQKKSLAAKKQVVEASMTTDVRQEVQDIPELQTGTFHDRIAEMLYLVGLQIGYDSRQRYKVIPTSPYEFDVAWLDKGGPHVAVEVQDGGNLMEALERLRHARDFNFRKVVLVLANKAELERTRKILQFDEKLKHWIDIWSPESVLRLYRHCVSFHGLLQPFEKSTYREEPGVELT